MTAAARNDQRLVDMGFSEDRRSLYAHEINNRKMPEMAFVVASEGLVLSAEDKTFALEWLDAEYPRVDPYEFR